MKKVAIVFWSGTGNTAAMADEVLSGANEAGAQAVLVPVSQFDASTVAQYDAIAFGCPAMGAEELEDGEFAPVFDACKPLLAGKPVALFGSYGWGDGEWMRSWEAVCTQAGAELAHESVICMAAPDADALAACHLLGIALA